MPKKIKTIHRYLIGADEHKLLEETRLLNSVVKALAKKVTRLAINTEKMKLAEYVDLLEKPYKLIYINFISGIARGFGIAIGFAILGALITLALQRLVELNLPLIGEFIADLVKIVQTKLSHT